MRLIYLNNDNSDENYVLIETKGLDDEQIQKAFKVKVRNSLTIEAPYGLAEEWPADRLLSP